MTKAMADPRLIVRVQAEDFDLTREIAELRGRDARVGAVVSFVGTVRDLNQGDRVSLMELEHAPGLTENSLTAIGQQALDRFDLYRCLIIHRVGPLAPLDQIVLVATTAAHRGQAFQACEFVMDYLKTDAPFWKKEQTAEGARWVDARDSDQTARARWR